MRATLLASLLVAVGCAPDAPPRGSAVLITLDTTRADALGAYGAATRTPVLDGLAARGVVYERAYTVTPMTLPSHASMLTGLVPPQHGIRDNGHAALPEEAVTVAEVARGAGYATGAFVAAVVLEESFGLDQGFDVYDAPAAPELETTTHVAERPGSEVVERALAWLRAKESGRPFFLWVHLFEPHAPYEPPADLLATHGDAYAGEVAAADRLLAPLVEELEALPEPVTIVVVADHGEALGEHGEETHGYFLYEPTMAVPLIVAHADGRRAGERTDAVVSVVDVAPTLAGAMGLPTEGLGGRSLLLADPPAERGVYLESYAGHLAFGWSPIVGWVQGDRVYLRSSREELYDLAQDPRQERNLAGTERAQVGRLQAELGRVSSLPSLARTDGDVDEALLAGIRSLGYAAAGAPQGELPSPLDAFEGPSPHDRAEELRRTLAATADFNAGRLAEALAELDRLYADNPRNLRVLGMRVNCLLALGRNREAIAPLQEYLRRVPGRPVDHFNLAVCLKDAGRIDEALASFEAALERLDEAPAWLEAFLGLLAQAGRADEVARWRARFAERP